MSNYVYEEPIIIPNYSSNITLTSGSSTKTWNGSALSNHTVTQSNFSITDLNTNTKCSNIKFIANYSNFPSITNEGTVPNTFSVSNKQYFINNVENITQYILPENEYVTIKNGTLKINAKTGPDETNVLATTDVVLTPASGKVLGAKMYGYTLTYKASPIGSISPTYLNTSSGTANIADNLITIFCIGFHSASESNGDLDTPQGNYYIFYISDVYKRIVTKFTNVNKVVYYSQDWKKKVTLSLRSSTEYARTYYCASADILNFSKFTPKQIHIVLLS